MASVRYRLSDVSDGIDLSTKEGQKQFKAIRLHDISTVLAMVDDKFIGKNAAEAIWDRAYDDGHAYGFHEVDARIEDLLDMTIRMYDDVEATNELIERAYPCRKLGFYDDVHGSSLTHRSNCPNWGSSDCPLTVDGAECNMTYDELVEIMQYFGR